MGIERLGEENYNTFGTLMKIVEYNRNDDVIVEFQDEYKSKVHTSYQQFKNKKVKNPYDKEVFGIGYIGQGKYKSSKNKNFSKIYNAWVYMLRRCYDPYYLNKYPTYIDVYVCDEWHNFQNFAQWWEENVYNCNNERMHLDKDILIKGNKIYSPETCIIVPERINLLFVKSSKNRGKHPIGVHEHYDKKYGYKNLQVCCSIYRDGKKNLKYLGTFPLDRPFQAFTCYKNFKEKYIKQIADEYNELIPKKLYNALYNYEVEIND